MAKPKISLYIDTVSPFAYLAYYLVRHSPVFRDVEITYVPYFLGGLMKACGNTPPIAVKNKGTWINVERLRWARLYSIPMCEKVPDGFPVMTLGIQRALCALLLSHPQKYTDVQDALYKANWVDRNVAQTNKPEGLTKLLAGILGEDAAKDVMQRSTQAEAKALLSKNTDAAFADGAFGAPWFQCTNAKGEKESFWGFDHVGQVVDFLGLELPAKGSMPEGGWRAML